MVGPKMAKMWKKWKSSWKKNWKNSWIIFSLTVRNDLSDLRTKVYFWYIRRQVRYQQISHIFWLLLTIPCKFCRLRTSVYFLLLSQVCPSMFSLKSVAGSQEHLALSPSLLHTCSHPPLVGRSHGCTGKKSIR